jgi:hypothetical protein
MVYNTNNPYFFNTPMVGLVPKSQGEAPAGYEYETILKKKKDSRNGSIVKALKNL